MLAQSGKDLVNAVLAKALRVPLPDSGGSILQKGVQIAQVPERLTHFELIKALSHFQGSSQARVRRGRRARGSWTQGRDPWTDIAQSGKAMVNAVLTKALRVPLPGAGDSILQKAVQIVIEWISEWDIVLERRSNVLVDYNMKGWNVASSYFRPPRLHYAKSNFCHYSIASPVGSLLFSYSVILKHPTSVSNLDPNAQKNRIPTEAELIFLRNKKERHSRIPEQLQEEMKQVQATHDILLNRYHRQVQELEGTQSQLHESKKSSESLSKQYSVNSAEIEQLSGILHPIRRFSPELLQSIFEFTSKMAIKRKKIDVAIAISHVCQRWRFIAVDTPRLWCYIDYTLGDEGSSDVSFWDCMVSRMKSIPASIIIRDFGVITAAEMSNYRLIRGSVIRKITFRLTSIEAFDQLLSLPSEFRGEQIKAFIVKPPHMAEEATEMLDAEWNLSDFFEKFSSIEKFDLRATSDCSLHLNTSKQYNTVTTLHLQDLKEVNALGILSTLTRLSEFRLMRTTISQHVPVGQVVSTSLRCLIINMLDENYLWISHLSSPNLVAFHQFGADFPEVCLVFIESHPSITTLDFGGGQSIIPRLARGAPQLRTLFVEPSQLPGLYTSDLSLARALPFRFLEHIGIYLSDDVLTVSVFESLVRTRCLPGIHPNHQTTSGIAPLHVLAIIHISKAPDCNPETPWRTSNLFKIATQTVGVQAIWGDCPTFTLSWE